MNENNRIETQKATTASKSAMGQFCGSSAKASFLPLDNSGNVSVHSAL
jgi:hypothetical protein